MLLRKLIIFDYSNELAFFEAEESGVICGGEEDGSESNSRRMLPGCANMR